MLHAAAAAAAAADGLVAASRFAAANWYVVRTAFEPERPLSQNGLQVRTAFESDWTPDWTPYWKAGNWTPDCTPD